MSEAAFKRIRKLWSGEEMTAQTGRSLLCYGEGKPQLRLLDVDSRSMVGLADQQPRVRGAIDHAWARDGWLALNTAASLTCLETLTSKPVTLGHCFSVIPACNPAHMWMSRPVTGPSTPPRCVDSAGDTVEALPPSPDPWLSVEADLGEVLVLRLEDRVALGDRSGALLCSLPGHHLTAATPHAIVMHPTAGELALLHIDGTHVQTIKSPQVVEWSLWGAPSPDGRWLLLDAVEAAAEHPEARGLWLIDLVHAQAHRLGWARNFISYFAWTPDSTRWFAMAPFIPNLVLSGAIAAKDFTGFTLPYRAPAPLLDVTDQLHPLTA